LANNERAQIDSTIEGPAKIFAANGNHCGAVQQSHHRLSQDSLRMSEAFQQHSMSVGLLHGPDVGFARHFEAILGSEMFGFFPQNTSGILR